jgi:excinuclease UvrABC nuclease subunit
MDIKNQILEALGLSAESVNLEYQEKLEDGTIIVSTADSLTEGSDVSVLTEDGQTIPLPEGTYRTQGDDGISFTVKEEGVVASIDTEEATEEVEAKKEEEEYEEVPAEEVVEEVIGEVGGAVAEVAEAINDATGDEVTAEVAEQAAEIAVAIIEEKVEEVAMAKQIREILEATKKEFTSLKSELKETKEKLNELSDLPATNAIELNKFSNNTAVMQELSAAEYNKLSSKDRYYYNLSQYKNK